MSYLHSLNDARRLASHSLRLRALLALLDRSGRPMTIGLVLMINRTVVETKVKLGESVDPELVKTSDPRRELLAPNLARSTAFEAWWMLADRFGMDDAILRLTDRLRKRFQRIGMPIAARWLRLDNAQAYVLGLPGRSGAALPFRVGEGLPARSSLAADEDISPAAWRYVRVVTCDTARRLGIDILPDVDHPGTFYLGPRTELFRRVPRTGPPGEREALLRFYAGAVVLLPSTRGLAVPAAARPAARPPARRPTRVRAAGALRYNSLVSTKRVLTLR